MKVRKKAAPIPIHIAEDMHRPLRRAFETIARQRALEKMAFFREDEFVRLCAVFSIAPDHESELKGSYTVGAESESESESSDQ